ncbi:hypothetical protein H0H81_008528 [Sphagnurus paluster]|uniref:Uncharacterized protein n=1 Tax=Sphagnurus paluster TaxID=117069 RepID=A0A9P7GLF8_9AGAR|nr:hypothetical protein H0H81_008528 [Sphagnurus paluster]
MPSQRPSLLTPDADPHDSVLCRHFNVSRPTLPPSTQLPPTITVRTLGNTHLPTHILAVSASVDQGPPMPPLLFPIEATIYSASLRAELPPPLPTSPTTSAFNHHTGMLTLPLVPLYVPSPPTLALLLLFALGLEPVPPYHLLPPPVVEEFPNSAAMAQVLARTSGLTALFRRNEGLWKNVLALGVREQRVVEVVGMVWNVTAEARKLRIRTAAAADARR